MEGLVQFVNSSDIHSVNTLQQGGAGWGYKYYLSNIAVFHWEKPFKLLNGQLTAVIMAQS